MGRICYKVRPHNPLGNRGWKQNRLVTTDGYFISHLLVFCDKYVIWLEDHMMVSYIFMVITHLCLTHLPGPPATFDILAHHACCLLNWSNWVIYYVLVVRNVVFLFLTFSNTVMKNVLTKVWNMECTIKVISVIMHIDHRIVMIVTLSRTMRSRATTMPFRYSWKCDLTAKFE